MAMYHAHGIKWSKHDRKRVKTYRTRHTSSHMTFPWTKPSQRASWSVSPFLRLTASLGSKIDTLQYKWGFSFIYISSWLKTCMLEHAQGWNSQEAHESFIFIRKTSACLNKQDKERAICTGLSAQTSMHERSTPIELY